jgi:hypothetical protein
MKKFRISRADSSNGEIHFILEEFLNSENLKSFKDCKVDEIKRISKKEASKPLTLLREE